MFSVISLRVSKCSCCYFCLVAKSRLILCNPMDGSAPGFPFLHCLLESAQTHVHWVSNAIHPSHPLSHPFSSCPQSFRASGSFPMSWLFSSGGQSIFGASASVLPMYIQGWFLLGLTGLTQKCYLKPNPAVTQPAGTKQFIFQQINRCHNPEQDIPHLFSPWRNAHWVPAVYTQITTLRTIVWGEPCEQILRQLEKGSVRNILGSERKGGVQKTAGLNLLHTYRIEH